MTKYLFIILFLVPTLTFANSFPEPMVYDLMRGLDAKKGELEFNVLSSSNFSSQNQRIQINPEIEYAIMDGLAFELEIPIDRQIVSTKWGLQYTLTPKSTKFMMGLQGIYEKFKNSDREDFSLATVLNYRLSQAFSLVAITGLRDATMSDLNDHYAFIMNVSLFYQINDRVTLGLENDRNIYFGKKKRKALTIPQVSWKANQYFKIQSGVAFNWHDEKDIEGYARFIFEF